MISIVWPALIALVGLVLILMNVAPPERGATIGRILLLAGMIAVCLMLGHAKFGLPG
jgi:hypothetical protein